MGFKNDLKEGKDYEAIVMGWLNKTFALSMKENDNKTGVDLVSDNLAIEVKYDRQFRTTWNLFIEYLCSWKPSGIFKDDDTKLFIYGDLTSAYIFDIEILREFTNASLSSKEYRLVKGWDWWRVSWLLLPIDKAISISEGEIFFK